jgi:hypothetical protein
MARQAGRWAALDLRFCASSLYRGLQNPARLIVWLDCGHPSDPDPAEMVDNYSAEMTVPGSVYGLCTTAGST